MINQNFLKLQSSYLFSDIAKKVKAFKAENPEKKVISLGIGDVTQPLADACIQAMHKAVDEMSHSETFRGYGPEQGYDFLREAIIKNDYETRGVYLELDEVFVSDGAKSDCGNIGDILDTKCSVGVTDPVYPVYVDSNVMSGRAGDYTEGKWSNITFLPVSADNQFVLIGELVHSKDCNDVLQLVIFLKYLLHPLCCIVMLLSDNVRVEDTGCGLKRVHGRIDTQRCNLSAQYGSSVQMRECCRRSRVRKVIGRHINGLYGCDGSVLCGSDTLLKSAHLSCQSRLRSLSQWKKTSRPRVYLLL